MKFCKIWISSLIPSLLQSLIPIIYALPPAPVIKCPYLYEYNTRRGLAAAIILLSLPYRTTVEGPLGTVRVQPGQGGVNSLPLVPVDPTAGTVLYNPLL